jgi:hypothetical protein
MFARIGEVRKVRGKGVNGGQKGSVIRARRCECRKEKLKDEANVEVQRMFSGLLALG